MMKQTALLALALNACTQAKPEATRDSVAAAIASTPATRNDSSIDATTIAHTLSSDTLSGNNFVDDEATVSVCVEPRGHTTVYHYEVANGPRALLRVFRIGLGETRTGDVTDNPDGGGELDVEPPGVTGSARRILPPGATSPTGWHVEWQRVEETSGHVLVWRADSSQYGIRPRETRSGFSISVPGGDSSYATAHWTLLVDAPHDHSGRLSRIPWSLTAEACH